MTLLHNKDVTNGITLGTITAPEGDFFCESFQVGSTIYKGGVYVAYAGQIHKTADLTPYESALIWPSITQTLATAMILGYIMLRK